MDSVSGIDRDSGYPRAEKVAFLIIALAIIMALIPWYSHRLQIEALRQSENGDQVRSLHIAEDAARANPLSIDARFVLAGAQQRLGRVGEARKSLVGAVTLQPLNYETWTQLALYERDEWDQPELAARHFAIAISLSPYDDHLQIEAGVKRLEDID